MSPALSKPIQNEFVNVWLDFEEPTWEAVQARLDKAKIGIKDLDQVKTAWDVFVRVHADDVVKESEEPELRQVGFRLPLIFKDHLLEDTAIAKLQDPEALSFEQKASLLTRLASSEYGYLPLEQAMERYLQQETDITLRCQAYGVLANNQREEARLYLTDAFIEEQRTPKERIAIANAMATYLGQGDSQGAKFMIQRLAQGFFPSGSNKELRRTLVLILKDKNPKNFKSGSINQDENSETVLSDIPFSLEKAELQVSLDLDPGNEGLRDLAEQLSGDSAADAEAILLRVGGEKLSKLKDVYREYGFVVKKKTPDPNHKSDQAGLKLLYIRSQLGDEEAQTELLALLTDFKLDEATRDEIFSRLANRERDVDRGLKMAVKLLDRLGTEKEAGKTSILLQLMGIDANHYLDVFNLARSSDRRKLDAGFDNLRKIFLPQDHPNQVDAKDTFGCANFLVALLGSPTPYVRSRAAVLLRESDNATVLVTLTQGLKKSFESQFNEACANVILSLNDTFAQNKTDIKNRIPNSSLIEALELVGQSGKIDEKIASRALDRLDVLKRPKESLSLAGQ